MNLGGRKEKETEEAGEAAEGGEKKPTISHCQ